jgi:hypothetical protein
MLIRTEAMMHLFSKLYCGVDLHTICVPVKGFIHLRPEGIFCSQSIHFIRHRPMKQLTGQICAKTFHPSGIHLFKIASSGSHAVSLLVSSSTTKRFVISDKFVLNFGWLVFVVDNAESLMVAIPAMSCRLPRKNYLLDGKY